MRRTPIAATRRAATAGLIRIPSLLLAATLMTGAQASIFGRVDFDTTDAPFTDAGLRRGIQATAAQCDLVADAIWAQVPGGDGECLRYWHAGFSGRDNPRVMVFFHGDLLAGSKSTSSTYSTLRPSDMQAATDKESAKLGVPYIFFARPGGYGSSGDHRQRRRVEESRLISAALDGIKKKYGIQEFVLAGQSGGGHVVASLLTYRSDIVCAVPSSGAVSPAMRAQIKGHTIDSTGYSDSYEPTEHLDPARMNPRLRVFVVGNPLDANVPWASQTVLSDKLQAMGVDAQALEGVGSGAEGHGLQHSGRLIAAMCFKGASTEDILRRARRGLSG